MKIFLLLCLALIANLFTCDAFASDKESFWNSPRAGANCFNQEVGADWFNAARERKIQFVRLTASKWKAARRDFLIGDADRYEGIPSADLEKLKTVLDMAHAHGIKIIITPLSLPGDRWLHQNGDNPHHRLWQDLAFQAQAVKFWVDLATALRDHPAVVGYNIINEPSPERATNPRFNDSLSDGFRNWYDKSAKGTPADLNLFYQKVVAAIRRVDKETAIILDSGQYATVYAFDYLTPIAGDSNVLYSFHQYEPAAYTNIRENKGRFTYPGSVTSEEDTRVWNADGIKQYVKRVADWSKRNRVPANRILVGEFGVNRVAPGAPRFLQDNIAAFDANGWHWAFYSFREDTWEGMDYELGAQKLPEGYYQAKENGTAPPLERADNPVFKPLKDGLRRLQLIHH